jgi:hypothetical protein
MSITALALGGWISVYCGISLLRTSLPENKNEASDPRRKLAAAGYILVVLGLIIIARAFLPRIH